MIKVPDITITNLETIKAFGLDGVPRFVLDELQNAKIANTQEEQEVTGKAGRKLNRLKKNKAVTISGTNGLISGGMMEAQTGGTFANKASTPVSWTDYLSITSNEAETNYKAVGTAGAEIDAVYVKAADGTLETKLEQAATAAEGKFAYNPGTKKLTFNSGDYDDGTEIVVFYTRNIAGAVLANESDKFSEKLTLYIDGFGEDICGKTYRIQFYIPKADFTGDFDLDLGGDQTVHSFEAESLASAGCSSLGNSGALWTYTIFDSDAPDAN